MLMQKNEHASTFIPKLLDVVLTTVFVLQENLSLSRSLYTNDVYCRGGAGSSTMQTLIFLRKYVLSAIKVPCPASTSDQFAGR